MILDRLGRKPVLGFAQLLAGVTCIGAGFMGAENLRWIQVSKQTNSFVYDNALAIFLPNDDIFYDMQSIQMGISEVDNAVAVC